MKKVIIVPDSFKGNMSSMEICRIIRKGLVRAGIRQEITLIPVADGGEGTVDAFVSAVGGEKVSCRVHDPLMRQIDAFYGLLPGGDTAVIEMAAASGLPLVRGEKDPVRATTFGTGELILDACVRGVKKIIIGLGGSATNDGGAGMASALGAVFLDEQGNRLSGSNEGLERVFGVDLTGLDRRLQGVEITVACDVDNPLTGERGASAVFGPQKGADEKQVSYLDENLSRLAKAVSRSLGTDFSEYPGAGAAGGTGFALMAFLGARLTSGIDVVLDTARFDEQLEEAGIVITGEGRIDGQSAAGKVPVGVARRAKKKGVPVIAVVGDIGDGADGVYGLGITSVFSINRVARDYSQMRARARTDLEATAFDIGRLLDTSGLLDR